MLENPVGTGFLVPLELYLLCTTVHCVSPSMRMHCWCDFGGCSSWLSGGPSHWRVSLTTGCLEILLASCLTVQGSLVYRLTAAESVHGTLFSCASVADALVLVWACPLTPNSLYGHQSCSGSDSRMLVGVPFGHSGQLLTIPTVQPRSLLCLLLIQLMLWPKMLMCFHVHPAIVRPPCSGGFLVSLPHRPISSRFTRIPLPSKTTLALFMVLEYG